MTKPAKRCVEHWSLLLCVIRPDSWLRLEFTVAPMSFAVLAPRVGAVTILFALCEYCYQELAP